MKLLLNWVEISAFEIIFVDDGSRDKTYEKIEEISRSDKRVIGIRLSRNFGHQTALLAGLNEASGDVIIMMDADGQHPPSMIPALIKKLEEGFDVVNTTRMDAKGTGLFKRLSSRWFYRVFNMLSDTRIEPASADFRCMNRKALDAFLTIEEHGRFTRGLVSWMGFRQTHLPYQAQKRAHGRSKYSLKRMRLFAFDGVTSFSTKPLRISMILGLTTILGRLCIYDLRSGDVPAGSYQSGLDLPADYRIADRGHTVVQHRGAGGIPGQNLSRSQTPASLFHREEMWRARCSGIQEVDFPVFPSYFKIRNLNDQ